jgi:hypothetical protein
MHPAEGPPAARSVAGMEEVAEPVVLLLLVLLTVLAGRIHSRPARLLLVASAAAVWFTSVIGFVAVLGLEHSDVGPASLDCPVPGGDGSTGAPSRWTWIPPGEICEYASGEVRATYMRIPFALGLVVIPVVAVVAWPRRRRADRPG